MKTKFNPPMMACLGLVLLTSVAAAQTVETIRAFTNSGFNSLRNPSSDLLLGSDGNFYGTTHYGGSGGFGVAFKVTTTGELTVLANFNASSTGGDPQGGLELGTDGSLYGTTYFSGPGGVGTVFRLTTNGFFTRLYAFSAPTLIGGYFVNYDGAYPNAGLTLGLDGCFYGVTSQGGTNGTGTVFKITTNGLFTTIRAFDALVGNYPTNATGARPYARLTLGSDGHFYGTAMGGGTNSRGTVFKVTTNGAFTTLVHFEEPSGADPKGVLIQGPDGTLYGTTLNGGIYGQGTVFKVTTNGVLTTLVSFSDNQTTGRVPEAGVTFGLDGNLYGTTATGNTNGPGPWGTVFRVTTNGVLTTLANFSSTNGYDSRAALTLGPDGNFYGTTLLGGSSDTNAAGGIYRFSLGLPVTNNPPGISISRDIGGTVILNLASTPGSTNRLWAATNLNLPTALWQVLATNLATNGFSQFRDTNTSGNPVRFYRLSTP